MVYITLFIIIQLELTKKNKIKITVHYIKNMRKKEEEYLNSKKKIRTAFKQVVHLLKSFIPIKLKK